MHENFISLDTEKRDRIINAAMHEFALKGYKNASTNEITKNAGISKSLLFYYFSSKEELFKFLYRYSMDYLVKNMKPLISELPDDIFERWTQIGLCRIKIATQYPEIQAFSHYAVRDESKMVQEFLQTEQRQLSYELLEIVNDGIDLSKFKPDIDVKKALQVIWWVFEGFGREMRKQTYDPNIIHDDKAMGKIIEEIGGYAEILRQSFYKEEYIR